MGMLGIIGITAMPDSANTVDDYLICIKIITDIDPAFGGANVLTHRRKHKGKNAILLSISPEIRLKPEVSHSPCRVRQRLEKTSFFQVSSFPVAAYASTFCRKRQKGKTRGDGGSPLPAVEATGRGKEPSQTPKFPELTRSVCSAPHQTHPLPPWLRRSLLIVMLF